MEWIALNNLAHRAQVNRKYITSAMRVYLALDVEWKCVLIIFRIMSRWKQRTGNSANPAW
jgi:hypothetical protein